MGYYSCQMLEGMGLHINGRIDCGKEVIGFCCENLENIPKVAFSASPVEMLRNFVGQRGLAIAESKKCGDRSAERRFTSGCQKCGYFQNRSWASDGLIHYVNLSMYPSPCQCRCIYCGIPQQDQNARSEAAKAAYETLFDMLEIAENCGIIAPDAAWQISCGEIAIHPYKDRIMRLVRAKNAVFYTNCIKFDEDIAGNLHNNPNSSINLSIDAGTAQTWRRVKGLDNFEQITSNLARYYAESAKPGQITLKYIVLPDVNDIYEDYVSLVEIMKVLEVPSLLLSRDTRVKYTISQEECTTLTGEAAYLLAICGKNGISCSLSNYTPEESRQIVEMAKEILRMGQI